MLELIPLLMFLAVFAALMAGYPVAFTLAGVGLLFAFGGHLLGIYSLSSMGFLPGRIFGVVTNETLIAVPLFVLMGVMLEKSRIAENLLSSVLILMRNARGGLAIAVTIVGMLLAASTGIVGATVVAMGLIALPSMLRHNYDPQLAAGTIAATGTLGQIIPPSIALVLLGDVMSNAYQQAQLSQGIFAPRAISVGDLFAGALIPGLLLVALYLAYLIWVGVFQGHRVPVPDQAALRAGRSGSTAWLLVKGLLPPLALIVAVLGSILAGIATPTEAAGVGALGATLLALGYRSLDWRTVGEVCKQTLLTSSMVFFILIGASIFALVFRGYDGDLVVQNLFEAMPGGVWGALAIVMLVIFLLGFILDFIEITFVVVPIVAPILLAMGIDPIWLGVMIAVNLQTSFLTPPFGFALFYLRGVTPSSVSTYQIYRGVVPYIGLLLLLLILLMIFPQLATWLPDKLYPQ